MVSANKSAALIFADIIRSYNLSITFTGGIVPASCPLQLFLGVFDERVGGVIMNGFEIFRFHDV
jgi:hypothetical protein